MATMWTWWINLVFLGAILPLSINSTEIDVLKFAQRLRNRISGDVYLRGSPEYETARPVHNGACRDIYPLMIVRPKTTEDVSVTVQVTVSSGLELSVRSGGHSFQCQGTKVNKLMKMFLVSSIPMFVLFSD
jgi:hypothetical protein